MLEWCVGILKQFFCLNFLRFKLEARIGFAYIRQATAGLQPDGRRLVSRAREECAGYKDNFGVGISGRILARRLSYVVFLVSLSKGLLSQCVYVRMFVHVFTQYWSLRPFGVSSVLGSFDDDGPQLFMINSSGETFV